MAGFTIPDQEGSRPPQAQVPTTEPPPGTGSEAEPLSAVAAAPTTDVGLAAQERTLRRSGPRSAYTVGGPFALPRREYGDDRDVDMEDVSGDDKGGGEKKPEELPPNKRVQTMPTLPSPPIFRGSTAQDKQRFMKKYEAYCRQLSALETAFFRPYRMPVGACVEDERRRLIAMFDICKPLEEITEADWIDYFWEGRIEGELDFDKVKAIVANQLCMDTQLADADSRVSKLAHELYQVLEKDNMEWMIDKEPKKVVAYLVDALAPEQFRRTVKSEMTRESNKPLTKNVVAFIQWLRTSCKEFVRWEPRVNQRAPSTGKSPPEKTEPTSGKQGSEARRGSGNEGRTPRRKRTCLTCGSEEHRVKDCPLIAAGEAETLLREWREEKAAATPPRSAPQPPAHQVKALHLRDIPLEPGSGCVARVESVLDLDNVLLDSRADVNAASRGLVNALVSREVTLREDTCPPQKLSTFDGNLFEVISRVFFDTVQIRTTAGPLLLRNTPAWVFEQEQNKHTLVLSRPVMERLGYSVDAILAQACDTQHEWDLQDLTGCGDGDAIRLIRDNSLLQARPRAVGPDDGELRTATPELGPAADADARVAAILSERVMEAADAGPDPVEVEPLTTLLREYQDVFRITFGRDPQCASSRCVFASEKEPRQCGLTLVDIRQSTRNTSTNTCRSFSTVVWHTSIRRGADHLLRESSPRASLGRTE